MCKEIDGVVRKIDCRHKVSLPAYMLEELGMSDGDLVVITNDADGIHITKKKNKCVVCGVTHDGTLALCAKCLSKMRIMIMEQEKEEFIKPICRTCKLLDCTDCNIFNLNLMGGALGVLDNE